MSMRLSLLSLISAGFAVAAQGPLTSSLVGGPNNFISTDFTTILTTVIITITSPPSLTTTSPPPIATTTTLFVSSTLPPITTTTTVYSSLYQSSSSNEPTNAHETPMGSGTLPPIPTTNNPENITHNPGALAGLIIGICVLVAGLVLFALFTIRRHKQRELENQALHHSPINPLGRSASPRDVLRSNGHHGIIDGDHDLEIQSSIGNEMRASPGSHHIIRHFSGILGPGEILEQQLDYEAGYLVNDPTVASGDGHSSPGHGTITRNSSLTHVTSTPRNASPTLSRKTPRFSIGGTPMPSSWQSSRSEAPTRRGSIDEGSNPFYPSRVNSEPVVFHHDGAPQLMSVYPQRLSSEQPRPEMFQLPGPSIVVHPTPQTTPSSLLGPRSTSWLSTRPTLERSHSMGIYHDLPDVNEQSPSPTASNVSILPRREGLLSTPPHPTSSQPSLSDDRDWGRRLAVPSGMRDSMSMADVESDTELHPDRDGVPRRSMLG
ncbi:hypothetical protein BJ322DRAFT_654226 [Thelephora terrestris]|uniref:Uncharacterized protein n=1 Tax=Thelephora terrestris TaxID=56493 RepID=A0A9P6HMY3_9AGAM|nr:hypothetical protein BJ322DRAFT_654226 [Thelephora terrestris]